MMSNLVDATEREWESLATPFAHLRLRIDESARLPVLADRFTLDSAVAVATRDGMTRGQVLDHFDELVRRSLVSGPNRIGGIAGYRLLESVGSSLRT